MSGVDYLFEYLAKIWNRHFEHVFISGITKWMRRVNLSMASVPVVIVVTYMRSISSESVFVET